MESPVSELMDLMWKVAEGETEGEYKIEGEVKPDSRVVVVKPDGTKYPCYISPRGKVGCDCPGFLYRGKCKHQQMVEHVLEQTRPKTEEPAKKLQKEKTEEEKEAERIPLSDAQSIANEVREVIKPAVEKVEFGGSLSRGRARVHDVDLVAVGNPGEVLSLAKEKLKIEPVMSGESIVRFKYKGVLVDISFAKPESWGSTLLYRRGPRDLNLIMRARAKRSGWKLNEYGLFDEKGSLITSDEKGIFEALGMKYLTPEERERVKLPGR